MVISYFNEVPDDVSHPEYAKFYKKLQFLDIGILAVEKPINNIENNQVSRLTLSEKSLKLHQIKKQIQKQRRNYELIIIEPVSAQTAAFAVRDNRVDYIRLNPKLGLHTLNKRFARRLTENDTMVEIDLSMYFSKYLARDLRPILRILDTFATSNISYWLTNSPNKLEELRSYRGLQAMARLLDLPNSVTSSKSVLKRVERNKKKLKGTIPFSGVEIDGSQE